MKDWKQRKYLIYEYQQTLLEKTASIPSCYFADPNKLNTKGGKQKDKPVPAPESKPVPPSKDKNVKKSAETILKNEKDSIAILRYVVEELLHWSPSQMRDKFNKEVIDRLKLGRVTNMIIFPPETSKKTDYFVYAFKLYPESIQIDRHKLTTIVFDKVIKKELSKFPKGFFDDSLGRYRAVICLNYVLTKYSSFDNIENLYAAFSGTEGKLIIKKYHLDLARRLSWETALDYVHESLSPSDRNEVWFHFYKIFPTN